jgi:hypothetical protein
MNKEQYNEILDAHEEENLWYFFLNYGNPLENTDEKYAELYYNVQKALDKYCFYMNSQKEKLNEDRELYL